MNCSACQLQITPQILELLNLLQTSLTALIEPEALSSSQTPVVAVFLAESSTQTEPNAGHSFVERAVSPTPPFGILKNEKDQLQENYENDPINGRLERNVFAT
ncbi:unnamed protein product [Caenorhabditis nigoni]